MAQVAGSKAKLHLFCFCFENVLFVTLGFGTSTVLALVHMCNLGVWPATYQSQAQTPGFMSLVGSKVKARW